MNNNKLGFVVVALFNCFQTTSSIKLGVIRFSRRLPGYEFKTTSQITLLSCADECQRKVSCESINYNNIRQICELNSESENDSLQLQEEAGWVFSDRSKWSNTKQSICKNNFCGENETCIEEGYALICKTDECRASPVIENGTILGNMNNIGSVLVLMCHSGFVLVGSKSFVCTETGEWDSFEETRCEILCQSPPLSTAKLEIADAFIKTPEGIRYVTASNTSELPFMMIMQGSNATYQCKNGNYAISIPFSFCQAGEWSMPVTSCIIQCDIGKSYSYSMYECVSLDLCVNGYANTFQKYESIAMSGNDYQSLSDISENDCLYTCLADPECNSLDYCNGDFTCPLISVCYIQRLHGVYNAKYFSRSNWSYYQRNCK